MDDVAVAAGGFLSDSVSQSLLHLRQAECNAIEHELNQLRRQVRRNWEELGLTPPKLVWRTRLAGELRGLADVIAAGTRGGGDDFLAGFHSASRNVIRTLTTQADAVDVPRELFSPRGWVKPLEERDRL